MQKTDFIEQVAKEAAITKTEADKVVNAALHVIQNSLKSGEKVTLTGFGTFEVRNRGAREVKSIRGGNTVKIAESKLPAFKAGSVLKSAVGGKAEAPRKSATAKKK